MKVTLFALSTLLFGFITTGTVTSIEPAALHHPVSIDAMMQKEYDGRDFTVGNVLAQNAEYTRYYITYKSGELTISGIMNVPNGEGPYPVLILNHGYIDPAIYTNGRGLKREQDYFAKRGYVVIHPDYRNHADSSQDPNTEIEFRLGYVEDVINAVYAIQNSGLTYVDTENIGMLGHSMGGGITINAMVIKPDLLKAAMLYAPTNADAYQNYMRWTVDRTETASKITELYQTPEENPAFWSGINAYNYFDRIKTSVQIHHGSGDDSVPIEWSNELETMLLQAEKEVEYYTYDGAPHEFVANWPTVMERTADFFDEKLK